MAERGRPSEAPRIWVCEWHPDKLWPSECNCGAGMLRKDCSKANNSEGTGEMFKHEQTTA